MRDGGIEKKKKAGKRDLRNPIVDPRAPWYSDQILAVKRMRRKAERKWRLSNSTHDLKENKSARNFAVNLIKKARSDFYENLIQENSSD